MTAQAAAPDTETEKTANIHDGRNKYLKLMLAQALPNDVAADFALHDFARKVRNGKIETPLRGQSDIARRFMMIPGMRGAVRRAISGKNGNPYAAALVESALGSDKWYTGPAKVLVKNPIGRGIVANKTLDRFFPAMKGFEGAEYENLARSFENAGGGF